MILSELVSWGHSLLPVVSLAAGEAQALVPVPGISLDPGPVVVSSGQRWAPSGTSEAVTTPKISLGHPEPVA